MHRPSYFLIATGVVALTAVLAAGRLMPAASSARSDASFETRVRAYLMSHPDVARDALARIDAGETAQPVATTEPSMPEMPPAEPQAAAMDTAAIVRHVIEETPVAQVAGNPNGDVIVVLFFDYRCPYCKAGVSQEKAFLAANPNARIVYRDLAILGAPSGVAARAALASARQRKYLQFHDALMTFRGDISDTDVFGLAMQVGLDLERLKADMEDPVITATLTANLALARALKVEGTPAYVVGDHVVSGFTSAYQLQELADEVRGRGRQVGAAR
ncbi:MAG TPA: DsbA family protein [Alphaproteobacteria bacterium]|jgi:protein-disulfide isomerase|nr:DsbA family protein [Alphaproteobacteria bacterium]